MSHSKQPRVTQVRRDHSRLKVTTVTGHRWTDADEAIFLAELATSSNVTTAAKAAGFSRVALYNRRRLDAAFAARWQAAVEQGVAEIQVGLVHAARAAVGAIPHDPDCVVAPITFDQALNLLKLHGPAIGLAGAPHRRYGSPPRRRSLEEVKESLLRKVEAVRAALPDGRGPDDQ
jgi:hypothetical protein